MGTWKIYIPRLHGGRTGDLGISSTEGVVLLALDSMKEDMATSVGPSARSACWLVGYWCLAERSTSVCVEGLSVMDGHDGNDIFCSEFCRNWWVFLRIDGHGRWSISIVVGPLAESLIRELGSVVSRALSKSVDWVEGVVSGCGWEENGSSIWELFMKQQAPSGCLLHLPML